MLTPGQIYEKWIGLTESKSALSPGRCLLLAILAGADIGFGGLAALMAQGLLGGAAGRMVGACVFPVGLIMISLAGGELFTGNCLMFGPLFAGHSSPGRALPRMLLVYLGNFIGACAVACVGAASGILAGMGESWPAIIRQVAQTKTGLSFAAAFLRGMLCNILVCTAVWMASGAESAGGKAVCCFGPIMAFVLLGMEHSVANMFYFPLAMLSGADVTAAGCLLRNLLPVTLGNIAGGMLLSCLFTVIHQK